MDYGKVQFDQSNTRDYYKEYFQREYLLYAGVKNELKINPFEFDGKDKVLIFIILGCPILDVSPYLSNEGGILYYINSFSIINGLLHWHTLSSIEQ
ncbi:hypothetical protein [Rossellomorea sp. BNER]|uniref:hypothetical protein n=1 Tax=Rossellomorea sp. BNER TaxID=2962031 RepID=UPI003AF260A0|nr:hypothetical protein [Rossellomorea sp. BNER]